MKRFLSIILLLGVGVAAGISIDRYLSAPPGESAMEHAVKHQDPDYICPMHSEIVSHEEGSCPICGMDLVPIKPAMISSDDDDAEHPVISVSSTVINNLGVRVAQVERSTLVRQVETPGYVQSMRKERHSRVSSPAKGKVIKFHFKAGQWIKTGDALVDIALDELVLLQEKHLELLLEETSAAGAMTDNPEMSELPDDELEPDTKLNTEVEADEDALTENPDAVASGVVSDAVVDLEEADKKQAAKKKMTSKDTAYLMQRAGMTEKQIKHLEETGETSSVITLYASHEGMPLDQHAKEGDEVKANGLLFTLGGLMRVTVLANAFQRDAGSIQAGQEVDIFIPGEGSEPIKGSVLQGAVSINNTSQNIGVKLVFSSPISKVKSGMYLTGRIYARTRENALSLPREAVIYTGKESRVVEALGKGRFKPVVVKTGITTHDRVEILEGLEEGDTIVVSSQFLLDSESNLQSSYQRMTAVE
ncbi:MAG: efflux RND transporter periplasmic adaptor subunit [Proteobacteria bacterium]|nr:efflux RND transporter periplasmic adaptor subunit [Pseudomonadota bacterium]